ncbi:hypothetical protein WJX72_003157 [[Myrmecia] bisecta]|uniref:ABM domain-containing protein n=1 Tax=[Myrmecia] bisecta TaxID=41462 RepID=A0AAW1QEK6_9CHLO
MATAPKFFRGAGFWIWLVITTAVVLLPTLLLSLAFEQTVGILCDYYLLISFATAWHTRKDYASLWRSAFLASLLHFSQIWPLVAGTVLGPCHPASRFIEFLLVTGSMPCFYFYTDFALKWDELTFGTTYSPAGIQSADSENETLLRTPNSTDPKADGKPAKGPYQARNNWGPLWLCVTLGLLLGAATILPVRFVLPQCKEPTTYPCPVKGAPGQPTATAPVDVPMCLDPQTLVGTTSVIPKPGMVDALMQQISTMVQPIRREEGCVYYNVAKEKDTNIVRWTESWSSLRTLLKHMLTSPTVARTFGSPDFEALFTNETILGPYAPLVPCSEAQKKASAKEFRVSTPVAAPVDCIWSKLDNWSDVSWVQGTLKVQMVSPIIRTLTNAHCTMTEMRQVRPPVPQPAGGHRLIYHVLDGCLVGAGTPGEVYTGDLSVLPSPDDPSKSVLSYHSSITAKDPATADAFFTGIYTDFTKNRMPYVRGVFEEACKPAAASGAAAVAAPPAAATPPALTAYTVKDPAYFYLFQTKKAKEDKLPFKTADEFLTYITGGVKPAPKAIFVGAVTSHDWTGTMDTPEPNVNTTAYDVAAIFEFPPGPYTFKPADLGKGIAFDIWSAEVFSQPYPQTPADAPDCPDSPWLSQVKADSEPIYEHIEKNIALVAKLTAEKSPLLPPDGPTNGINLLRWKPGKGGCYTRYLQEVRTLIQDVGGHLHFWGGIKPPAGSTAPHFEAILIPYYPDRQAFLKVALNPIYRDMALTRLAAILDAQNIGAVPLEGSLYQML